MTGDRMVEFAAQVESLGLDLDEMTPTVPSERGRSAWVIERVRQSIEHIRDTHGHVVETVSVQAAPEDLPGDLQAQWPWPEVPIQFTSEDNGLLTPVPSGLCRLWLQVAQNPDLRLPTEVEENRRLADMTYTHGLLPTEAQEDALRALPDLTALWPATDPASLTEALDSLSQESAS